MSRQEYLRIFTKHLRVGEPKRGELLVEINHHLDEATDANDLGDPIKTSRQLNRVHIGWLCSERRMMSLIVATVLFTMTAGVLAQAHMDLFRNISPDDALVTMLYYYSFLVPAIVAVIIGRHISRMHSPQRSFFRLMILTVLFGAIAGIAHDYLIGLADIDIPDTLGGVISASFIIGLGMTGLYAAAAFIGVAAFGPIKQNNLAMARWQANFTAITVALFVGFVLITSWGYMAFQPLPKPVVWPVLLMLAYIIYRTVVKVVRVYRPTVSGKSSI